MKPGYRESYERQARDFLAYWRENDANPWMPPDLVDELDEATAEHIARLVPAGSRILDVGCSIGNLLNRLPDMERHGIDIAEPVIAVARERGIDAVRGEAEALPYPDEHFDCVMAVDVMEHVLDPNIVAAEMLRVLRPGGLLVVRSPDSEDMAGYVHYDVYPFCHLRRWDDPSWRLFWQRIFGCQVEAIHEVRKELIVLVRKP